MTLSDDSSTDASVAQRHEGGAAAGNRAASSSGVAKRARTIEELEEQFALIGARAQTMVSSASAELCAKRPTPESWSASECLHHLSLSADAYLPVWQQVIATAGPRKAEMNAPYAVDFWGRLLCWILEPPARIRAKTPAPFQPVDCGGIAMVLHRFLERQERIIAALRRCRGRAVDEVKMASPVDARIRYSIWSSFVVNAAHERRHLWQAEQAIARVRRGN